MDIKNYLNNNGNMLHTLRLITTKHKQLFPDEWIKDPLKKEVKTAQTRQPRKRWFHKFIPKRYRSHSDKYSDQSSDSNDQRSIFAKESSPSSHSQSTSSAHSRKTPPITPPMTNFTRNGMSLMVPVHNYRPRHS